MAAAEAAVRDREDEDFEAPFSIADEELIEILRNDDDERRLEALEDVGEVGDEAALELLGMVASDSAVEVRAAAAIALGPTLETCEMERDEAGRLYRGEDGAPLTQATYERVVRELEAVYRDPGAPTLVRRRALEAAVRAPRKWQEKAIRHAWAGDDPAWRVTALFCMGEYPDADFTAEVRAGLAAAEVPLRAEAMVAAAHLDMPGVVQVAGVAALDEDEPRALRLAAIVALAFTASPDAEPVLGALAGHPDTELADAAERALEELSLRQQLEAFDEDEYEGYSPLDDEG